MRVARERTQLESTAVALHLPFPTDILNSKQKQDRMAPPGCKRSANDSTEQPCRQQPAQAVQAAPTDVGEHSVEAGQPGRGRGRHRQPALGSQRRKAHGLHGKANWDVSRTGARHAGQCWQRLPDRQSL